MVIVPGNGKQETGNGDGPDNDREGLGYFKTPPFRAGARVLNRAFCVFFPLPKGEKENALKFYKSSFHYLVSKLHPLGPGQKF